MTVREFDNIAEAAIAAAPDLFYYFACIPSFRCPAEFALESLRCPAQ